MLPCFRDDYTARPTFPQLAETLQNLLKTQSASINLELRDVGALSGVNESSKLSNPLEDMPEYENMKDVLNDLKQKQLDRFAEIAARQATLGLNQKGFVHK